METRFLVKKQWRAVGACEYDIFHRDRKNDPDFDDIVGEPEEIYAVMEPRTAPIAKGNAHVVICDCYTRADARRVAKVLNAYPELVAFVRRVMNAQYDDGASERIDAEALLAKLGKG
jgi:hypothetical protein